MPNDIELDTKDLRPNLKIISSTSQPVYTASVSTDNPAMPTVEEDLALAYNKLQNRFTVSTGAQNVAKGNVIVLYITIPANVEKTIYLDKIRAGNSDLSQVDFFLLTSGATTSPLIINNTYIGSSTSTKVTAGYNTTDPTPANAPINTLILSGGVNYEADYGGRSIFQIPLTTLYYCVRVKNIGNTTSSSMISLSWWEV